MEILYPVFAMVALTAIAAGRLAYLRITAVRSRQISIGFFRAFTGHEEPAKLIIASRQLRNLFEMPVLFYASVVMVYVTGATSTTLVLLAWGYVALRYVHTAIHLGANNVIHRFWAYAASCLVLAVLWVMFGVRLLGQGG